MTGTPSKDRAGAKAAAIANLVDIAREEGRKAGFAEGMKRAAEIAQPPLMHRKGNVGLWRQRRKAISDAILAEIGEA